MNRALARSARITGAATVNKHWRVAGERGTASSRRFDAVPARRFCTVQGPVGCHDQRRCITFRNRHRETDTQGAIRSGPAPLIQHRMVETSETLVAEVRQQLKQLICYGNRSRVVVSLTDVVLV